MPAETGLFKGPTSPLAEVAEGLCLPSAEAHIPPGRPPRSSASARGQLRQRSSQRLQRLLRGFSGVLLGSFGGGPPCSFGGEIHRNSPAAVLPAASASKFTDRLRPAHYPSPLRHIVPGPPLCTRTYARTTHAYRQTRSFCLY
ncbi:hypothetical protein L596_005576 [Steinernema carpocapsae]|uniref:Uncharacterized protein n=1 Tax=Steinernema carpocapsae TaxID=34508 RepID=A0A4V6I8P4_STECR|nr:hypothetical protein L596_005576 [Steinernema carpocapsae]